MTRQLGDQAAAATHKMGLLVHPLGGTIILAPPLIFTREQPERTAAIVDAALDPVAATVARMGDAG